MGREFLREFMRRAGSGIKRYLKAILWTSLINFIVIIIGLYYLEVPYYGLIAFGIGVVDLLPVIGAGIILIPWSIIVLVQGKFAMSLILMALYIITLVLRQILQPLLLGRNVGPKPAFTLTITSACMLIFGPGVGAIVGSLVSIVAGIILDMRDEGFFNGQGKNFLYEIKKKIFGL